MIRHSVLGHLQHHHPKAAVTKGVAMKQLVSLLCSLGLHPTKVDLRKMLQQLCEGEMPCLHDYTCSLSLSHASSQFGANLKAFEALPGTQQSKTSSV
jgi:hypothetical protein